MAHTGQQSGANPRVFEEEAKSKAYQGATYLGIRLGEGAGGGLVAGVAGNELVAAWRRKKQNGEPVNVPEHPFARSIGCSAMACAVVIGAGAAGASQIKPNTLHYDSTGQIEIGLSTPDGMAKIDLTNAGIKQLLLHFQDAHRCPDTPVPPKKKSDEIRATTYNIKSGQINLPGVAEQLQRTDSNIMYFQEITPDTLKYIADKLGMQAIPGWASNDGTGDFGNAIVTNLPVLETSTYYLPSPGVEQRAITLAKLRSPVNGKPLIAAVTHLVNPHPSYDIDTRTKIGEEQAEAVAQIINKAQNGDEVALLGADTNQPVNSAVYKILTHNMSDTVAPIIKTARTFPGNGFRIDDILMRANHGSEWKTDSAFTGGSDNSDHCLVSATFKMTGRYVTPAAAAVLADPGAIPDIEPH